MKKTVLIDGSNMLFRAYYAIPAHLSTSTGQPTNAVYGFVTMLSRLMERKNPDFAAVVFDPVGGSFRHRESADYKANRESMPSDLASQIPLIDRTVEAFDIPVLRVTDFEADDVIATLARQAEELGHQVLIVSSDKDFSQLVNDNVLLFDGMRDLTYNAELVEKKFGVPPHRFVDFQALCGDKIDNIPGVPGIGKKTASKLLQDYGTLDGIFEHLDDITGSVGKKIRENLEQAQMSRRLARLDTNVDHGLSFEQLAFRSPAQETLNGLFREFEFFSLLKATGESVESKTTKDAASLVDAALGLPPELTQADIAVTLVAELSRHRFDTAGIAMMDSGSAKTFYLEDPCGANVAIMRTFWKTFEGSVTVHGARDLFRWFQENDFKIPGRTFDTQTSSYLIDPGKGMPHDLVKLAKIHLQKVLPTADELLGTARARKSWRDLDRTQLAEYSALLCTACLELRGLFEPELQKAELLKLAEDEVKLSRLLASMERSGIKVEKSGLEQLSAEFHGQLLELKKKVFELAGKEFNIGSTKQLASVLFEDLKLPVLKKTKTGYSTNAEVLEKLAETHEIAQVLLEYRKFEKLINTYVDVLIREIDPEDGRVHCRFGQTASTTGRLITSEPDLQRTPVKTEEGRQIRKLFQAEEGSLLLVADWSQVELRIMASLSEDAVLVDAFSKNEDIHKRTASELFSKPENEVTKSERDIAKTVNFATIYGQGASALGQNLGIAKKEAQDIITRYFEVYSGVKTWIEHTMDQARVEGSVRTLAGRTRFIPELFSKNFAVLQAGERMAVNTPVQGSAADICKKAMLDIDHDMKKRPHLRSRLLLQIHDELVFECPVSEIDEMRGLVIHHMENGWKLAVPLIVSVGVGTNWEEAK